MVLKTLFSLLIIIGVIYILLIQYRENKEGFNNSAQLPISSSNPPKDAPGASTSDPTVSFPQTKDIQATIDSLNKMKQAYQNADTTPENISNLSFEIQPAVNELLKALKNNPKTLDGMEENYKRNLDGTNLPQGKLTNQQNTYAREMYDKITKEFLRLPRKKNNEMITDLPQPSVSPPQTKDVQATMNSLKNMYNAYKQSDYTPENVSKLPKDIQDSIKALRPYPILLKSLKDELKDPRTPLKKLTEDRVLYDKLNKAYSSMPKKQEVDKGVSVAETMTTLPKPTVVAGPVGQITVESMKNLRNRIQEEINSIQRLRSSSATLNAKKEQLEKLNSDLNEMINKVERKQLDIKDVQITETAANAFLQSLPNEVISSTLITPKGRAETHPAVNFPNDSMMTDIIAGNPNIQSLLENAKYLKWNIQVNMEFNPELAQNDRFLKRLEEIEARITNLAISETPIPKELYKVYITELKTIKSLIAKPNSQTQNIDFKTKKIHPISTPDYPSSLQLDKIQGNDNRYSSSRKNNLPETMEFKQKNDYPDFKKRGSNSSFDTNLVGGLDYKERAKNICQQIKGASIGDPAEFGCIEDQNSVSNDYSWKGNFQMVCSRLGNTWGGWYPEMFGCHK